LKKIYLLIILFFFSLQIKAQQYSFINYTVKDGLAQTQVIDICQDNLGYLWIATQSGLSRFDGQYFVNYSKNEGLSDNTVQKLLFDSTHNILWVATPRGISSLKTNQKSVFNSFLFDQTYKINDLILKNDTLYIATNSALIMYFNQKFHYIPNDLKIRSLGVYGNDLICASKQGLYKAVNQQFIPFLDSLFLNHNYSDMIVNHEVMLLSAFNEGVYKYDFNKEHLNKISNNPRILNMFQQKHKLWLLSDDEIILLENNIQTIYNSTNGLPKVKLRCLFVDDENNLWIGTNGKGLLKFSGESVVSYTIKSGLPSDIIMSISQNKKGDFAFGSYDKGAVIFKDDSIKEYYNITNGLESQSVWSIINGKDSADFFMATSKGVSHIKEFKTLKIPQVNHKIRSLFYHDNSLYMGGKACLWIYDGTNAINVLDDDKYDIKKIAIYDQTLYLATKNGFFWQNLNQLDEVFHLVELHEESCNTFTKDRYGNLWIGTGDGLFVMSPSKAIIEVELDKNNFKAKNILALITDREHNVWCSTTYGLYLILKNNPFTSNLSIFHYGTAEGIEDLECNLNALYEDHKGFIWLGTSSALYKINPRLNKSLFNQNLPKLSLTGLKLFKEDFDYTLYSKSFDSLTYIPNSITFPPNLNHLTFNFKGINLKNPQKVKYSYRLKGAEDNWSPLSNETSATYSFITPGTYQFQVKATNDGVNWTPIKSIEVVIRPYFWQTWWFISMSVIAILLVIWMFLTIRIKNLKRKKDTEKLKYKNRLRELEQQSLNASMNRHFIFNSLNSIQYFINSSDKRSANKFLSNFAKLIRKNLDSSTADNFMVNLDEEIERINLYLSLEKMRFGNKFDFEINLNEDVDTEMTKVPSMILQPFVENSIIHGVLPKEGKGFIKINIKKEYDALIFEVIDNGVGIDESSVLKSEFAGDHESKGMQITENRIELIRKINGSKLLIIGPFQLNDENGNSKGTKVIIKLPLNEID
jgi:ligand-binding sensor domain-containing protein/two-component sensor histidine kinase